MNNRILIIAAHADDEVLGCGGTIARHVRSGDEVNLLILSDGETSRKNPEVKQRSEALKNSCAILGIKKVNCLNLKDSLLDGYPLLEIIRPIEEEIQKIDPHIIYTHNGSDLNQDHRQTYLATMTAARSLPGRALEKILTYEIPSSTEGSPQLFAPFRPNYFVALFSDDLEKKWEALKSYECELRASPHARSLDFIKAMHTIRGGAVGVAHAEAFFLERSICK